MAVPLQGHASRKSRGDEFGNKIKSVTLVRDLERNPQPNAFSRRLFPSLSLWQCHSLWVGTSLSLSLYLPLPLLEQAPLFSASWFSVPLAPLSLSNTFPSLYARHDSSCQVRFFLPGSLAHAREQAVVCKLPDPATCRRG